MSKTNVWNHRGLRALLVAVIVATTGWAVWQFVELVGRNGVGVLDIGLIGLFSLLTLWITTGFWTATFGFGYCLVYPSKPASVPADDLPAPEDRAEPLSRTAIVMPVYNEDPVRTCSGIAATWESLTATGHADRFEVFMLSDTTDPKLWLREQQMWAKLRDQLEGGERIFYRHRRNNTERKSGNIADFCRRWGQRYEYMIVLDADSVMEGATLVEMVRRMDQDSEVGILQAPPVPVNCNSLFARMIQFASSVYGRIFTRGMALWTGTDANYYGHNAILRVRPFVEHCGLPKLPGAEPLGGEILSHDFVEAALMRRAGWKVRLDSDLGGSYEECPSSLIGFAQRDQRWCQGNLQHLRLIFLYGFHPSSRIHLSMGAMSFLSSPLWLVFMLIGGFVAATSGGGAEAAMDVNGASPLLLFGVVMGMLLLPKLWGFGLLMTQPREAMKYGGASRALGGVLLETVMSVVIAPIMMAFHTTFVVAIFAGRKVQWSAQERGDRNLSFRDAFNAHAGHTIIGLAAAWALAVVTPALFWWTTPVLFGLVFSIPISLALGSVTYGTSMRRSGILLIPEETRQPAVLARQRHWYRLITHDAATECDPWQVLAVDPAANAQHIALLDATGDATPIGEQYKSMCSLMVVGGSGRLTRREKMALLHDPEAVAWLHREVWRRWPIALLQQVSQAVGAQATTGAA
ncbi:glucans biosynthesis glucosyltransferase MdoH [Planctomycetales bacterium ZRK34]|nr:glucans biosynthesis glucosyltransferase MdoH [Planctomycetales bacterium ZRK34]